MKPVSFFCSSKLLTFFSFAFIFVFTTGFHQSLVYSPSANLPPRPLKKWDVQFLSGIGMFPETRPFEVSSRTAVGGEITIRLALSDYFTMQAKGWIDLSGHFLYNRSGISVSSLIMFNDDKSLYRVGIMPTGAILFSGRLLQGFGSALPICLWFPEYKANNFYISCGPGFGTRGLAVGEKEWGWGILLNVGTSILFSDNFTLNFEISSIVQKNEYENLTHFILSPSFTMGLLF